jgi:multimeric flavodoxin WrbA
MNVIVLNGSPKGDMSVTLQYAEYIRKKYPDHRYRVFNVAQNIKSIESKENEFDAIIDAVREADVILWAFPLYVLLVHANMKRFIELVFERGAEGAFAGKYGASISTSIKFFDNTANDYMQAISEDLGMNFVGFFAADMNDLMKADKRRLLELFAERVFTAREGNEVFLRHFAKIEYASVPYAPGSPGAPGTQNAGMRAVDTLGKKVVVIADEIVPGSNLSAMIDTFTSQFAQDIEVVDLSAVDVKGGCLGCLRCGYDNTCFWKDRDGYFDMYERKLKTADIIVFAGEIQDRYLSSKWKNFFDRGFYNTHQPSLAGKQWAFLISGPFSQTDTLRTILQAWTEFQQSGLAGIVTDECGDSAVIDAAIRSLAKNAVWAAERGYVTSETFLRVGGMKIFRDEVFGHLRMVFQSDHRYYAANGVYNFPQKNVGSRLFNNFVLLISRISSVRERFFKTELVPGMVSGHKRVVAEAKPNKL